MSVTDEASFPEPGDRHSEEPAAPAPAAATPQGEWVRVPGRGERGGGEGRRRSRRSRRRRVVLGVFLLAAVAAATLVVGGYLYVVDYFEVGPRGEAVTVTVPEGATLAEIAALLEEARVVPRARAFEFRVDRDGYGDRLRPGTYRLHVNEPYDDLVSALLAGVEDPTVTVTIPEGLTARQTAALLAEKIPGFTAARYVELTLEKPLPFDLPGFTSGGPLEGFLFPATYTVDPAITEEQFVRLQLRTFKERLAAIDLDKARAHNLTDYDVTILASMIEREIQVAAERRLAAAVMWNRLRLGMPLQIDATVQYALPEHKAELTYDDLKVESPYNTYLNTGLPPTPIANPGAAALRAAAHPAAVDHLYYVARGDGSGRHRFSDTYEQFLRDKAQAASE